MHIGQAVRHVRETLRFKLEMVAHDAGFDPGNLSRIENGRQNPSVPRLEAIARAMDVSVADIYALIDPPRLHVMRPLSTPPTNRAPRTQDWLQLRHDYERLDPEARELVHRFLALLRQPRADKSAPTLHEAASLLANASPANPD